MTSVATLMPLSSHFQRIFLRKLDNAGSDRQIQIMNLNPDDTLMIPFNSVIFSSIPFSLTMSMAKWRASDMSTPMTREAFPRSAQNIERIPVPQPRSRTVFPEIWIDKKIDVRNKNIKITILKFFCQNHRHWLIHQSNVSNNEWINSSKVLINC